MQRPRDRAKTHRARRFQRFSRRAAGATLRALSVIHEPTMRKIPKKYASLVFTFYVTMMMAFIMSAVLVALNTGIDSGWFARTLRAYVIAWPIAFFSLLCVRPLVVKLVDWTLEL